MLLNCKILLAKVKEMNGWEMKYGNKHVHRNYNFFNIFKRFKEIFYYTIHNKSNIIWEIFWGFILRILLLKL